MLVLNDIEPELAITCTECGDQRRMSSTALVKSDHLIIVFFEVIVFDDRHCSGVGRGNHCADHRRGIQADRGVG